MNVLVTGGAGFIGHHLIKKLLNKNYNVVSLDNYSTGKKENEVDGCEYIYTDLYETDMNEFYMYSDYKFKMCFHLAALARIQPSFINPAMSIKNNYLATLNVADFCRINSVPMIYAGSSSIHHDPLRSPYAYSKGAGEQLLDLYSKLFDLNCSTSRFYNVYGKNQIESGDYATVIGIFEKQYREKKPLTIVGDGNQRRDFTYVGDIVDALISSAHYLLDKKRDNVTFELGTGDNWSINQVATMFGKDYPVKYLDVRLGEYPETRADYSKAFELLNWKAKIKLNKYIESVL